MQRWCVAITAVLISLVTAAVGAHADAWTLENAALAVAFSGDGAMVIRHKHTGTVWRAEPTPGTPVVSAALVEHTDRQITLQLSVAGERWTLTGTLPEPADAPALNLSLAAPVERELQGDVLYPFPFRAPSPAFRFVVPQKTGLMFATEHAVWPKVLGDYPSHGGGGLAMPWVGLTDLRAGLMLELETPFDSGVVASLATAGAAPVFAIQPYWKPSLGTVGRIRRLHVRVFEAGGYVAMAKHYRRRVIERGAFMTLREKAQSVPALHKLVGAIDLHLRGDDASQERLVGALADRGAHRLLLNSEAAPDVQARWRRAGFLTGAYRLYTDIHAPTSENAGDVALTRGYPSDAYTLRDGTPTRGYMSRDGNRTTYRCSMMQLPLMAELVPPLVAKQGYQALFADVVTSLPPKECWHSQHRLDCAADIQMRRALLRYLAELGLVVGSEDGSDWACADVHYFEGMAMPRRFGYGKPPQNYANWRDRFPITDEYLRVDLNPQVRVPLFDLVYHDSVVSTWRWFYSPDLYDRPELWPEFDLLTMIAGNMPIFVLSEDVLAGRIDRLAETIAHAAAWHGKIGWDELVDHRALNAERTVQESRFSSGRAIVINFSRQHAFTLPSGATIAPLGYHEFPWRE